MVHFSGFPSVTACAVRLTLIVPELIWPEPADQHALEKLALPGLEWLLTRGDFQRLPAQPFETTLADCFGASTAPLAPLRLLGEAEGDLARDGQWLCADPVHLRFHHERIVLADAGAFELDLAEARALVDTLNAEFADIGQFHIADARRWYLRLAEGMTAVVHRPTKPISAIAGKRLDPELPGNTHPFTRWLNEMQMFLHRCPVNERRQAAGHPAVNSVWLWGGGALPQISAAGLTAIYGAHPLARGLARAAGLPAHACPARLADLPTNDEHALVVLDTLLPPVLYEDAEGWRSAAEALERDWCAPLRAALGRLAEVRLIAPTLYGRLEWTLHSGDRWKLWRKSRPLSALANEFANAPAEGSAA